MNISLNLYGPPPQSTPAHSETSLGIGWISRKDRVGKTGGLLHLEATTISNYYVEGEYKSQIRRNTKKSEYLQNCNVVVV